MKKRILCLILVLVMLAIMMPVAFTASADEKDVIYGAQLWVDVPVNGLPLNEKNDVEIIAAYTTEGTLLSFPDPMVNIFQTYSVTWYDTANPSVALDDGTAAQLGKTYKVVVQMKVLELFTLRSDLDQHPGTLVNGETPDSVSIYTKDSVQWLQYEKTFQTIEKSNGNPTLSVQKMELNPYEGNPAEIAIQVTGGTNVRYQWQLVYGSSGQGSGGLDFTAVINLADGASYQGCRTPHLKIHSYFGDQYDENTFFKIRCVVTTDDGKLYTEPVWYTLKDRQEVSGSVNLSMLGTPKIGRDPDKLAYSVSGELCRVTKVEWFDLQDGNSLMGEGEAFREGQYRCRIYIATADAYKFGTSTKVYLNGDIAELTTISGKDQTIHGADMYYIERDFSVTPGEDIVGDLTGDDLVDNRDVEYLLWFTLFPEDYPIATPADFDDDGFVDNKDVEYLLWHTLFPEDYPLSK